MVSFFVTADNTELFSIVSIHTLLLLFIFLAVVIEVIVDKISASRYF